MRSILRIFTLATLMVSFSLSAAFAVNYPSSCGCSASSLYDACNAANPNDELACAECCQNSAGADEDVPPNCIECTILGVNVTPSVAANCEASCADNG